jgi:gluconate 2-dehydrogenase gamma chain
MSEDFTRRDLFRGAAALAAVDVHHMVEEEKKATGAYKVKTFRPHEYQTLTRLSEMIIPGSAAAGAPEYIDVLASRNTELAEIYTGGLAWLDHEMERRASARFLDASADRQTALLEQIAYRKNDSPALGPGIRFFDWARRMVIDAFFTSKAGIAYLGYQGNAALARFEVPANVKAYLGI